MAGIKVLLLGESYTAIHTFVRGRNYVTLPQYGHFGTEIACMLEKNGFDVDFILTHDIAEKCPETRKEFKKYDVVILSDVGSDTMLVQPRKPDGTRNLNRLSELKEYVREGGGVLMIGGYFSFSGIGNQARYGMTPLAEILPVRISNYDDRVECPEGVSMTVEKNVRTALFDGIEVAKCPPFNGYNRTVLKDSGTMFASFNGDPFLVGGVFGEGRAFAFTSDCAPDWAPLEVLRWEGYSILMSNIIRWTAGRLD